MAAQIVPNGLIFESGGNGDNTARDVQQLAFMQAAVAEGVVGVDAGDGGPFGAVVVKDGAIVARGHNMVLRSNDPTAHAEVVALRLASQQLGTFDLSGCTLYTSCYPCPMCMGAALWARLDSVYYAAAPTDVSGHQQSTPGMELSAPSLAASVGFDDQHFHDFVRDPKQHGRLLAHLPIDGHLVPFQNWAQRKDKQMY